jgi:hypothetical protein
MSTASPDRALPVITAAAIQGDEATRPNVKKEWGQKASSKKEDFDKFPLLDEVDVRRNLDVSFRIGHRGDGS